MEARIEAGRQLSRYAAWKYDTNQFMSKDASICKAFVAALSMTIAKEIISVVGIEAIFEKNMFAKFYRDAKAFDILEGTGDMQRLMITKIEHNTSRNFRKLIPITNKGK
ncbi:MAG: acyl-CoA/acyl-ACP dehydrogenase [Gammaproteobacteria bacterium]|nr:acyl-CoA/acyl-ACP dehydrogenase [Gammaproteobacteria bacterium]